jgi:hypothetical protein
MCQSKKWELSLAHDMSALLAREMSAFQTRLGVDHSPGSGRDGLYAGRIGCD